MLELPIDLYLIIISFLSLTDICKIIVHPLNKILYANLWYIINSNSILSQSISLIKKGTNRTHTVGWLLENISNRDINKQHTFHQHILQNCIFTQKIYNWYFKNYNPVKDGILLHHEYYYYLLLNKNLKYFIPLSQFPKSISFTNLTVNCIPIINAIYLVRLLGFDSSIFYYWNAHSPIGKKIKTLAKRHNLWVRPLILSSQMRFTVY